MAKETTNNLIIKSNIINAHTFYKTPTELKIFSKLIAEIRADKENKKSIYKVWIKDLMEQIKFKSWDYSRIKKIASNMFWKITTIEKDWIVFDVIFTRINIKNSWYIEFKINEDIRPHITNLTKEFMGYFLENIADLKSYYSIRIYELLKQFESTWKMYTTIEKLKENLKIDPKQYKLYWHFKSMVLKVAQKEIKEKTDLNFTFEEHKTGKKIDRVTLYIWKNIKTKLSSEEKKKAILTPLKKVLKTTKEETKEQAEIRKILSEKIKIDNQAINKIFKDFKGAEKRILDNAKHSIKKFEQGKIKESLGGFFMTALKNNYANQLELLDPKKEQQKQALQEEKNTLAAKDLLKKFSTSKAHKIEIYKLDHLKNIKNLVPIYKDKYKFILTNKKIDLEDFEAILNFIENDNIAKINFNKIIEKEIFKNDFWTFEEWAKKQNINIWKTINWDYILLDN